MVKTKDQPAEHPGRYEFDDVVVDRDNYRVFKAGELRALGPRAFDLLLDLLQHPGRVVSKQELLERVWKGVAVTDNALTRAVKELRRAIGDPARAPRYVETVARRGYRFAAPVRSATSPARVMLVVLPFSDLSRDPEDYVCDGLTEEMITQIARLNAEGLGVIARTSAMIYKNSRKSVAEIGGELGVDYVLEGSIRRESGRVRIAAQLIGVRDQIHLWADSFDEDLSNILRAQRRVAQAVARAIRVELGRAGSPESARSLDPEAYTAYLKGRYLLNRRTADGMRKAIAAFECSIELEPTHAPAHAGLARCYMTFLLGVLPRAEAQPMAEATVRRALGLDDRLAEAHATLGGLESVNWNYPAAEKAFRWALAEDPNDADTHHQYAMLYLMDMGRFEEVLGELRRAQALDPLSLIVGADAAVAFYFMRQPTRAVEQCQRVLELNPSFARAHLYTGMAHSQTNSFHEAVASLETAKRLDDSPLMAGWLGYAYGRAGRKDDAQRILGELRQKSETGREVAYYEALVHTGLEETELAIETLERACGEKSLGFSLARFTPAFDPLRRNRRFQQLVQRIGLGK